MNTLNVGRLLLFVFLGLPVLGWVGTWLLSLYAIKNENGIAIRNVTDLRRLTRRTKSWRASVFWEEDRCYIALLLIGAAIALPLSILVTPVVAFTRMAGWSFWKSLVIGLPVGVLLLILLVYSMHFISWLVKRGGGRP